MMLSPSKRTIPMPPDVVAFIQQLDYESTGLRVLVVHAMDAGLPDEKVDELKREFTEKFNAFQLAKNDAAHLYGGVKDGELWRIDYVDEVITVEGE